MMPRQGSGTNDCGVFMCLMAALYIKERLKTLNSSVGIENVRVVNHRNMKAVGGNGREHIASRASKTTRLTLMMWSSGISRFRGQS